MDPEFLRPFHFLCYGNDLAGIQQYVRLGFPVNSHVDSSFGKEYSGYTPLHFAVKHRNKDAIVYLLNKSADITEQSDNSWTPVHLEFYNTDHSLMNTIFDNAAFNKYINIEDSTGLTHFHISCAYNCSVMDKFIENGADVNCPVSLLAEKNRGFTPLHFAVKYKNEDAMIHLLKKGADITKKCADSWTPVHIAYYNSDSNSVFAIFEHSIVNTYVHAVDSTGLSHFHICCALNVPVIETFIKNRAKVNGSVSLAADKNGGFTPLHFAVQNGHSSAARLLLANGANIRTKCGRGFTPLHVACERSDSSMVELLLTNDDNLMALTTKDNEGLIPLHVACKKSDLSVVELLLTFDADLNTLKSKDNRGRTALHYAAEQGCTSIVQLLMEKGASIDEASNENESPFDVAVKRKRYDVFELMSSKSNLENDPSVVSFSAVFSLDDFHDACRRGNLNDIAIFLKHGFPVDSHAHSMVDKKYFGHTPLHFAVENQSEDIVLYLLQSGADITEKNDYGCTPVHLAYRKKFYPFIFEMFKHCKTNASVNVADKSGLSHFHICCIINAPITIRNFILAGVDVNCATSVLSAKNAGFTPLHFAAFKGFSQIVELLLKNGADHSLKCANGLTPLHLACDRNNVSSAELLIKYGADIMAKDSKNRLPLHCMFYKAPDSSLATFFIGKISTEQNYTDSQRLSLLHMACYYHRADIVKKLLDQGCSPNSRVMLMVTEIEDLSFAEGKLHSGVAPLHIALYVGDVDITRRLILAGADINASDEEGHSTLAYIYGLRRREWRTKLRGDVSDIDVLIGNHVRRLENAGLYVSEKVKKPLGSREITYYDRYRLTSERVINPRMCKIELAKIQSKRVDGCADGILRRILGKSDKEMCRLVKNERMAELFNPAYLDQLVEEFPLYGFMIKSQVNIGLRKAGMIQNAKDSLNCLTGFRLPDLCSEMIFDLLRIEHLENLIDANIRK